MTFRATRSSEGFPGVEASYRGGCLARGPVLHWLARAPHPRWSLAGGPRFHGRRGPGSPVRHPPLRHAYTPHPSRACGGDLELVQEQLGRASIKITTIYAKVRKQEKVRAANALAKGHRSSLQNREGEASRAWRLRGSPGVSPASIASLRPPVPHGS